ncbi:unnamed protein product [Urochloa decumbens]|uniref:Uncharacterized protein n=1 Tax=Urochloa decumbens TaxID=240449 RepID=A0ABC8ZLA8_9POAL
MSMNCHREIQHRSYTMPHQEELRQLGALAPTFPASPSIDAQRRLPWDVGTRNRIPPMIPQTCAMDRRDRIGSFTPVAGFSKSVPNHQAVPKHASSSANVGYHHQTLKRKAMMTDLTLGSPTGFAVESTRNDFFGFAKNWQEEQTHSAKKARTPLLFNEDDDEAIERMAREIQFFPQHVARDLLGNESEFSVYERSSSYTGGFDASLDLSLNLSSSSNVESSMAMDLSLKLRHNPCP